MRDLKMALRNPSSFLNPLLFFIIAISLFPLAISPEAHTLSNIAPGVIWVTCMLAVLLSLNALFHTDYDNGVLEQMVGFTPSTTIAFAGQNYCTLAINRTTYCAVVALIGRGLIPRWREYWCFNAYFVACHTQPESDWHNWRIFNRWRKKLWNASVIISSAALYTNSHIRFQCSVTSTI